MSDSMYETSGGRKLNIKKKNQWDFLTGLSEIYMWTKGNKNFSTNLLTGLVKDDIEIEGTEI